jgi:hypothetical protein
MHRIDFAAGARSDRQPTIDAIAAPQHVAIDEPRRQPDALSRLGFLGKVAGFGSVAEQIEGFAPLPCA